MLVGWHPTRWWDWCMQEDEKKEEINPFLLMKSFTKLGSRKNVSSTKNKVCSFLLFKFVSKKLIVMTQN